MPDSDSDHLHVACPHCEKAFRVSRKHVGLPVACPHCGQASTAREQPARPTPTVRRAVGQHVCPQCQNLFQLDTGTVSGQQVVCPTCAAVVTISPPVPPVSEPPPGPRTTVQVQTESHPTAAGIQIPTEDGTIVTVREPIKSVRKGSRMIQLRQLSPAEKQRRRTRRNIIFWIVGAATLVITATILSRL